MFKSLTRTGKKALRDFIVAYAGFVAVAPTNVSTEDFIRSLGVMAALAAYRVGRDMIGRAPEE